MTRARIAWLALVIPLWVACVLCTHWEPVLHDGWSAHLWHRDAAMSPSEVLAYFVDGWRHGNPRLGQLFSAVLYAPGPYHAIVTPLVELAMFYLLTVLALGRRPSVRRADDALVAATIVALVALCTPQFGPMLFYRPFTGNYLYGFALNLLWLVPYRLHLERPAGGLWRVPAMLVLGTAAGLCNEHTGVAFLALGALATWAAPQRRAWMFAGLAGLLAGFLVLLLAPGQGLRYEGLAQQAGIIDRILDRGVGGNVWIVARLALYLAPALAWVALGLAARWTQRAIARRGAEPHLRYLQLALALAGVVCAATLLASPKLGPRLYLAPVALIATALASWLRDELAAPRWRLVCAAFSAGAIAYALIRCVAVYHAVGPVGVARLRALEAPGATVVLERYPAPKSRWFLGEDLDAATLREGVAEAYGHTKIELVPAQAP